MTCRHENVGIKIPSAEKIVVRSAPLPLPYIDSVYEIWVLNGQIWILHNTMSSLRARLKKKTNLWTFGTLIRFLRFGFPAKNMNEIRSRSPLSDTNYHVAVDNLVATPHTVLLLTYFARAVYCTNAFSTLEDRYSQSELFQTWTH